MVEKRKVLPYSRMPANKRRRNDGVKKSQRGNPHTAAADRCEGHQWTLLLVGRFDGQRRLEPSWGVSSQIFISHKGRHLVTRCSWLMLPWAEQVDVRCLQVRSAMNTINLCYFCRNSSLSLALREHKADSG